MADPLLVSQLGDLGVTTLPELNRLKIVEIATDIQEFTVLDGLLKKGNTITATGKSFQWDVMVNDSGTAANVGLGYQDRLSIVDTTVQATSTWANSKVDWAMIGQEEDFNSGPAKIVDLMMLREKASMIALVQLFENNFWGPPVASTDNLSPLSVKTWIVKNASEGFNGGLPSGYTTIGGLSPTTYPRWCNYTFQYTNVDDTDFVRKLNKSIVFTNFKAPVDGLPLLNTGRERRWFSNYGLIGPLQEYLKASNDNMGVDLGKYAGSTTINRAPVTRVPALEADTTNPIYGLNMADLKLYRLKNWWMRRTSLPNVPGQHTVKGEFLDSTYQFVFVSRRNSLVGATGTTEPS